MFGMMLLMGNNKSDEDGSEAERKPFRVHTRSIFFNIALRSTESKLKFVF